MKPIVHIRTKIFKMTQDQFGDIAGRSQGTVSRWESGEWEPNRNELERIRAYAKSNGIKWRDAWFFEVP